MQLLFPKKYLPFLVLLCCEAIFLSYKLFGLTFRFGDTTAYWYMARSILEGALPYKDFFLADPPFYVLFLTPLFFLFQSHLIVLQLLPALLEMLSAAGMFWYLKRENIQLYWLAPIVYLFSFTILATADYGTGLQFATALFVCSLLAFQRKKWCWVGILLAGACLTKLYMVPIGFGVVGYLFWQKKYLEFWRVIVGGLAMAAILVVPFAVITDGEFFNDVVFHHFSRPNGINKIGLMLFYLQNDGLLLLLASIGMYWNRKHLLVLPFVLMLFFLLFFQDVYYAYLGVLQPCITFFTVWLLAQLWDRSHNYSRIAQMIGVVLGFWLIYTNTMYWKTAYPMGIFTTITSWQEKAQSFDTTYPFYGSHEVAPLIALLSDRRIFENYIDTNTQTFASSAHDLETVSQEAVKQGVYLFTRVQTTGRSPEFFYNYSRYFSQELFEKHCTLLGQDSPPLGSNDGVAVFFCKSS